MGDFEDISRELREAVGGEIRAEAEEVERLVELGRRRSLDLAGAAREAMRRGDEVAVEASGRTYRGLILQVGEDYLTLETPDAWVEVQLGRVVLTARRRRAGGRSDRPGSATWVARLRELEQEREPLAVVALGRLLEGTIEVVTPDHLELGDPEGVRHLIPLEGAELVLRPRFPSRQ